MSARYAGLAVAGALAVPGAAGLFLAVVTGTRAENPLKAWRMALLVTVSAVLFFAGDAVAAWVVNG